MFYSINCQAICDACGKFIDVDIKWPGSVHDARVFANCEVQKGYSSSKLKFFYKELVNGKKEVSQILLGDPAYPLLPYLMKEYENCKSNEQVIFNQMLRSARNQIECAFGRLKARWRILNRPIDLDVKYIPNVILTCFALHNFCEKNKSSVDINIADSIIENENCVPNKTDKINSYSTTAGAMVRDIITDYFKKFM